MSTETFSMQPFMHGLQNGPDGITGEVEFKSVSANLTYQDVVQDIEFEIIVSDVSRSVECSVDVEGRHELDVDIEADQVVSQLADGMAFSSVLGAMLSLLGHTEAIQVVHGLASSRIQKTHKSLAEGSEGCSPGAEDKIRDLKITQLRRWEHIHSAVTRLDIPELEPEPTPADTEPPASETDGTEKSLYSASSVRDLVGMILADNERRPLMIGILAEAGYTVGKKVR